MLAETRAMDPLDHWSRHWPLKRCLQTTAFCWIWPGTVVYCGQVDCAIGLLHAGDMQCLEAACQFCNTRSDIFCDRVKRTDEAECAWQRAAAARPDYCFPHRLEEMLVLQAASEAVAHDGAPPTTLAICSMTGDATMRRFITGSAQRGLILHFPPCTATLALRCQCMR